MMYLTVWVIFLTCALKCRNHVVGLTSKELHYYGRSVETNADAETDKEETETVI